MANQVDWLPVATAPDANVDTQQDFAGAVYQQQGFQSGLARSTQTNKVWRQASVMSAAIANFIAGVLQQDVLDDGNLQKLISQFTAAIIRTVTLNAPAPAAGTGINVDASGAQPVISVRNTGVAAGEYGSGTTYPVIDVNAQGQVTGIRNQALGNFAQSADGHLYQLTWDGTYVDLYVDGYPQGGIWTTSTLRLANYVQGADGHLYQVTWDGTHVDLYVDGQPQGGIWTTNTLQVLQINGIGYKYLWEQGPVRGPEGHITALPGRPGTWMHCGGGQTDNNNWDLWMRIA